MFKRLFGKQPAAAAAAAPEKPKGPPTRLVTLNADGTAKGFYSDDFHAAHHIPADAVRIAEAQYQQWHAGFGVNPPKLYRLVGGKLVDHVAELSLIHHAVTAAGAGLTVTIKGLPASTKFPTNATALQRMAAVMFIVNATGRFSAGFTTWPMKDRAGQWHSLTVDQYKAIATAITSYVAACQLIADGNPLGATELPDAEVDLSA